ncbi:hypothetical protein JRO89_XS09G0243000 [Xanthoceras sorbifolium]|uniref:SHSP domain-containing protein n=1 Tax=Xanthoceras sorbifolium TaxID=99658 RepID=A0ABQ8HN23_9ROSI|nr:hypothetical protein JRO89_XS09G0243000 [Xanthoceras sorbifolium]
MSRVLADDVVAAAVNNLFGLPETIEKVIFPSRSNHQETNESKGVSSIPVDILDSPKEYVFYMDVPGLSKSDIQLYAIWNLFGLHWNAFENPCVFGVMVEDEKTLVIKSSGKRKHEDGEEEGCKYRRLERRGPRKLLRKFRLPENANVSAISAKCENGVLTVVVEKLPPPPKSKAVEVTIS